MKIDYKNASCVNCLNKIREKMLEVDGVETFEVDTINSEMILKGKDEDELFHKLQDIAKKIEPQMKIFSKEHIGHHHEELEVDSFLQNYILISGILLLIVSIFAGISLLKIASYALVSWDIIYKMLRNFKNREFFDENTLMAVASIGAVLIGEYYEAIAVILLYKFGEYLQDRAVARSKESIKSLLDLEIQSANLKVENELKVVDPKDVKIGDIIVIKAGEKVALDGVVVKGDSFLDLKAINGESKLVDVHESDEVVSGSLNSGSAIEIRVTKKYADSTISKISQMLKEAMKSRSSSEQFITKFARIYTPIVFVLALIVAFIVPIFVSFISEVSYLSILKEYINRSLIFLVISCPCALIISVPLAYFAGIGAASKRGILIKASSYLDDINEVRVAAFDKTGTITKGNFVVNRLKNVSKFSEDEFKELLALSEIYSNHPIALSILTFCDKKVDVKKIESQEELAGFGVKTQTNQGEILLGNAKLMHKFSVEFDEVDSGQTLLYLAKNGEYLGYVELSDEIKEQSYEMVEFLNEQKIKTILLTGDNEKVANEVAKRVNISEVRAKLLPEDKLKIINELKVQGKTLFIGDGINDAPALAASNVGVSMGLGSDLAIMSSDVVISDDNLSKIKELFKISKKTRNISLQNIVFSISFKIVILLFALFGFTNMWIAIIADVGVSLVAILNSIRILKDKI